MSSQFPAPESARKRTRRTFLATCGMAATAACFSLDSPGQQAHMADATEIAGSVTIDVSLPSHEVPRNFTGLSYESAQLANPAFFAASNTQLIRLFRELSPEGVLRLGGGSSEYTTYSEKALPGPPPFEVFGPDTSKTVKSGTVTSALALHHLRAFLDATGWSCLYGLNLGQGTQNNAVAEATAAYSILGPRLFALQIGNEPDSFRNRFRPASYGPEDFLREWTSYRDAIVARVPEAKFAGPDISNKLSYLTAFAAEAPKYPDIILLSGHYYAMGPAGNPAATADNLLSANPKLTTMPWRNAFLIEDAMHTARLPFRITEGNSCWNGGQAGVSDVFASALWAADVMLHCASLGFSGFNFHGGGNGLYSPIVGAPSSGFSKRPEYFGIQFGQHFAGTRLLPTLLRCSSDRVTAYAARTADGTNRLAVVNKTPSPITLQLAGELSRVKAKSALVLSAPSLSATSDIHLHDRGQPLDAGLRLQPYSACLFTS